MNLVEMINQTAGEFAEKFEHKNLELIQTLPDEAAVIHVDGRRMWRVLENIYNNAAKYAMPGTRIYADLRIDQEEVVFSLKNISEYPLTFPEVRKEADWDFPLRKVWYRCRAESWNCIWMEICLR